jgi:hypothetical protein
MSYLNRKKTFYRGIAQSVEHLTFNQTVAGSNPVALKVNPAQYWNVVSKSPKLTRNIEWLRFYSLIYNELLLDLKYTNLYEIFTLRKIVLNRYLQSKHVKGTPWKLVQPYTPTKFTGQVSIAWAEFSFESSNELESFYPNDTVQRNLFLTYLTFANGKGNGMWRIHAHHRSFFIASDYHGQSPYINPRKLYTRWQHTYSFLINVFYSQVTLLMFAHKIFTEETLSFNWSNKSLPYTLFKSAAPFFTAQNADYGDKTNMTYQALASEGFGVAFVADVQYHKASLFWLRRSSFYTVGLVPFTMSPWLVDYCLPAAAGTLFTQYFFIKFVIYLRQRAEAYHFRQLYSVWLL